MILDSSLNSLFSVSLIGGSVHRKRRMREIYEECFKRHLFLSIKKFGIAGFFENDKSSTKPLYATDCKPTMFLCCFKTALHTH